jgi:ankyrin repeat protein
MQHTRRMGVIASGLLLVSLVSGMVVAVERAIPQCVHWTNAFVFAEYWPRGKVRGALGHRLSLHPAHPQLCEAPDADDCRSQAAVMAGDRVTIGHVCGAWAYVEARRRASVAHGWIERRHLATVPPQARAIRQKTLRVQETDPLLRAAAAGHIALVRRLAAAGHALRGQTGAMALHAAARANQVGMVQTLLALGVHPQADPRSCALLTHAVDMDARIVHAVLTAGLEVNCSQGAQRVTPLMAAAGVNRAEASVGVAMGQARHPRPDPVAAAQLLLQAGAHVDAPDVWGRTALRYTMAPNNVDVARVLLDAGADVNNTLDETMSIGVQEGNTALLAAIAWYPPAPGSHARHAPPAAGRRCQLPEPTGLRQGL